MCLQTAASRVLMCSVVLSSGRLINNTHVQLLCIEVFSHKMDPQRGFHSANFFTAANWPSLELTYVCTTVLSNYSVSGYTNYMPDCCI